MTNTTWTTILGVVQAVAVATVDYVTHTNMEGGALKQPTFWVGLVIAAAMGLKGYLTKGIDTPKSEAQAEVKPDA